MAVNEAELNSADLESRKLNTTSFGATVKNSAEKFRYIFFPDVEPERTPCTRSEFWDLLKLLFGAFTLLSLLLGGGSLFFQLQNSQKEYAWRHLKEAQDILKAWDDKTGERKASLESFFRKRGDWKLGQVIRDSDAELIFRATEPDNAAATDSQEVRLWRARRDAIAMLNYFETISTAVLTNIADEAILKDSLSHQMVSWRKSLRPFTDRMDKENNAATWEPYYQLIQRWQPPEPSAATPNGKRPSHDMGSFERR